jgi:MerR HTH family regulatory protein
MEEKHFIAVKTVCSQYHIDYSFVTALNEFGLIQLEIIEQNTYLHQNQIGELEKMIRLHNELHLNMEGIDVVFNLLEKEENLRKQVIALKNRLRLYEDEP